MDDAVYPEIVPELPSAPPISRTLSWGGGLGDEERLAEGDSRAAAHGRTDQGPPMPRPALLRT